MKKLRKLNLHRQILMRKIKKDEKTINSIRSKKEKV